MSASLPPRALLFLPFTPRVGLPGPPLCQLPTRLIGSAQHIHVCRALCQPWGHIPLSPKPAPSPSCRQPAEAALPQGEGLTSWQEAPGAGPAAPGEGGGGTEGPGREGVGPPLSPLGAPLLASPEHLSPASWPCPHWCPGSRWQWNSRDSLPAQRKASAQTSPEPWPKWAPWGVDTAAPHCSSRHTTWAVARSRSASQTVPQVRPRLTSRRPAQECSPPTSRASMCPVGTESSYHPSLLSVFIGTPSHPGTPQRLPTPTVVCSCIQSLLQLPGAVGAPRLPQRWSAVVTEQLCPSLLDGHVRVPPPRPGCL